MLRRGGLLIAVCLVLPACVPPTSPETENRANAEPGRRSLTSAVATEITFVNRGAHPVDVYWLDYAGERKHYQRLGAGEDYVQPTFLTHPWLVADENGTVLGVYLPTEQPRTVEIGVPDEK